jgi:hypothetical protein
MRQNIGRGRKGRSKAKLAFYSPPPITKKKETVVTQSKQWYLSVGVWGAVSTIICTVFGAVSGITIDDDQIRSLAVWMSDSVAIISTIVALYGRVRATKKIV